MSKPQPNPKIEVGPDGLPKFVRWRVVVRPKALVGGILVDLAFEIILQQAGVQLFEPFAVLRALALGVLLGIVMPSFGLAIAVRHANREIGEARAAMARGADHATITKEVAEAHAATDVAVARGAEQRPSKEKNGEEGNR